MKKIYSFIVLSLALMSCSVSTETKNNQLALTNEINTIYQQKKFNGFAVSIVDEDGILYKHGFGFSDVENNKKYTTETIQNIGSVSKTFVGIALLKAQELGKLNLDDSINKYLPFKVCNPNFPKDKFTIRQLASHTSSITDNEYYSSKNFKTESET